MKHLNLLRVTYNPGTTLIVTFVVELSTITSVLLVT